jgi:hypothetical protein
MKIWEVRKNAEGTLFEFNPDGKLRHVRRPHRVREDATYDDGDVIDHIHVYNNERQGMNSMGFFPKHLFPAAVCTILAEVTDGEGCAIVQRGVKRNGSVYVLVLRAGNYRCMC